MIYLFPSLYILCHKVRSIFSKILLTNIFKEVNNVIPFPIPKSMMIQSSGRSLSIDFLSDEEVQEVFNEISEKLKHTQEGLTDIRGIYSWLNFYTEPEEGLTRFSWSGYHMLIWPQIQSD